MVIALAQCALHFLARLSCKCQIRHLHDPGVAHDTASWCSRPTARKQQDQHASRCRLGASAGNENRPKSLEGTIVRQRHCWMKSLFSDREEPLAVIRVQ